MGFMEIVYVVLWAVLALFCTFMAHKVHNILYLAGGFFLFMFGWNLANGLLEVNLQAGIYGWIYKGISIAFLAVMVIWYAIIRKRNAG